jgi:chromosome segregation ATPase
MERHHDATVQDLVESRRQLQIRVAETEGLGDQDIQHELSRLREQHADELAAVKALLDATTHDRDRARQQHLEAERRYQETSMECSRLGHEMEISSQAVTERSRICEVLGTSLSNLRASHAEAILHLRQELDISTEQARQTQLFLDSLCADHQVILDKLTRTEKDCENRLSVAAERTLADKRQLETELARSASQLAILQARYATCCETVTELERQLQDELSCRNAEREEHERELAAFAECSAQSESAHAKHQEEVNTLRKDLDQSKGALQAVQDERDDLQLHVTNLEAEIQRAVSLRRYLESQLKDR